MVMPFSRVSNPIQIAGHPLRDHCIVKHDGRWWLTGSEAPFWEGASPGVRLYVSDDCFHWQLHATLIDAPALPADHPCRGRFWAPELHPAHGRWWLTINSGSESSARRHGIFIWVSDAIDGPYTLVTPQPIGQGFKNDASLFTATDGSSYLYASGGGLWQAGIDLATGRLIGSNGLTRILGPRDEGLPEWMYGGIEGPCVRHRAGRYTMLFSAWTRGYEIGWLHAPTPLGPWILGSREPIFGTRKRHYRQRQAEAGNYVHFAYSDTLDPFAETGHCSVFDGPDGSDWMCCHYLMQGTHYHYEGDMLVYEDSEPHLGIEPIHFTADTIKIDGPSWD